MLKDLKNETSLKIWYAYTPMPEILQMDEGKLRMHTANSQSKIYKKDQEPSEIRTKIALGETLWPGIIFQNYLFVVTKQSLR